MKKLIVFIIFIAAVGTGYYLLQKDDVKSETTTVKLYYYNPKNDLDEYDNVMCSRQGLVAVEREIVTKDPIDDTIELLLKGILREEERVYGITTEYPLEEFTFIGSKLENNVLTLEFNDPLHRAGGGSCRVGVLWFQIEATALQFPEVDEVKFEPEELFQP